MQGSQDATLACEHQQEIIRHLCVAVTSGCLTLMAQHSSKIHKLSPNQLGNAQRIQTIEFPQAGDIYQALTSWKPPQKRCAPLITT